MTKHNSKCSKHFHLSEWPLIAIFIYSCCHFFYMPGNTYDKIICIRMKEGVELAVCFWLYWRLLLLSGGTVCGWVTPQDAELAGFHVQVPSGSGG